MSNPKVVVTTAQRGVFFGELAEDDGETVTLVNARNCVYWAVETRGFLGLAAHGPKGACRIGPAAPKIVLMGVTCVASCSDEAIKAWEAEPWV